MLKVAVLGAAGRMGRAVLSCVFEADDLKLIGAVTETGDRLVGRDLGRLAPRTADATGARRRLRLGRSRRSSLRTARLAKPAGRRVALAEPLRGRRART